MSVEIAVVGSCNLDFVVGVEAIPRVGETVLGGDLVQIPGGKGANQAVAAARLGRRVAMVGRVGDDASGALLRAALDDDGVDTTGLLTTPGVPSGVALIAVQDDGDNAIVVSPGANGRVGGADVAVPVVQDATVVLCQAEIPVEAVVEAMRIAEGVTVWNPAPAPADGVPLELLDSVDIVIPNETELALLAGHDGPVDDLELVAELARRLPTAAVVVTLGSRGALVVAGDDAAHVPAPVVSPVDTTAAGDSFCAAIADQLVAGHDLVTAASFAVRVGAATTLVAGAQSSLPTRDQVDSRLEG
ncbi:MAG: ribokinase [Actinomycetota bacterium]